MKKTISILPLMLATSFIIANDSKAAVLQVIDDPTWGVHSIVYDSTTGLDWLKPNLTIGYSYDDIHALFGTEKLSGFYYANYSQIATLFTNAGLPIQEEFHYQAPYQSSYSNQNPSIYEQNLFSNTIDMFGATLIDGKWIKTVTGITAESTSWIDQTGAIFSAHYLGYILYSDSWISPGVIYVSNSIGSERSGGGVTLSNIGSSDIGNWLVRQHLEDQPSSVPLPTALVFFISGIFTIRFVPRKNKSTQPNL